MAEYINKDALVAEIERLKSIQLSIFSRGETEESCYESLSCISIYNEVLSLIDTIEVKEVDLVRLLNGFQNFYAHENGGEFPSAIEIAEYFYELGLKALKG